MVFGRGMVLVILVVLVCATATGQEIPDDTQIQLVDVVELHTLHEGIDPMTAVISPDAETIVWTNADDKTLCLYTFADDAAECVPYPDAILALYDIHWSPDSRTIAVVETETYAADLWLFNIENREFTNRSNEGPMEERTGIVEFAVPIWDSVSGDLYYFRYQKANENCKQTLHHIPATDLFDDTEPELIVDFSGRLRCLFPSVDSFPEFDTLNGKAEISPNGSYIAAIIRPGSLLAPLNTVWLFNLEDRSVEQILPSDNLNNPSLVPEWSPAPMYPSGLAWSGDNLIIGGFDIIYAVGPMDNVYAYNLETETLTVLVDTTDIDLNSFYNLPDADGYAPVDNMPSYATVLPNGNALLYTYVTDTPPPRISVLPLPPSIGGDTSVRLGIVDEAIAPDSDSRLTSLLGEERFPNPASRISSVGENDEGLRVIMLGLLFTFERIAQ